MTAATVNGSGPSIEKLGVREIFFDFEGTLVDFQWNCDQAIEETLEALKPMGFHREQFGASPTYATIFNSIQKQLEIEKETGPAAAAAAVIDELYDKYDADAGLRWGIYPDTIQTLGALKELGFKMGLVSNIGRKALQATMDRLGLTPYLEVTVSRSDVTRQKPHAQGLLKAAAMLGADPSQCILIGDSREDVGAARNAGMLAGHLKGGQHSAESMGQSPADLEIEALSELPRRLYRIHP